jgi:hypothetical protein
MPARPNGSRDRRPQPVQTTATTRTTTVQLSKSDRRLRAEREADLRGIETQIVDRNGRTVKWLNRSTTDRRPSRLSLAAARARAGLLRAVGQKHSADTLSVLWHTKLTEPERRTLAATKRRNPAFDLGSAVKTITRNR